MNKRCGITLVELLVASSILVVVLAVIFSIWQFTERAWHVERTKSKMLAELETVMERMKREIMLSDSYHIFYYPEVATTYTAVSFPLASAAGGDGFVEIDPATGKIDWDKTVIYHLYTNSDGEKEFRRTVFEPRDNSLVASDRQTQLNDVTEDGIPNEFTPNYAGWDQAETRVLCKNDNIVLTLEPLARTFDGYSSATGRSENITFGSVPIKSGNHTITFKIIGTSETGHRMGIDTFNISPSGCDREGEEADQPRWFADSGDTQVNEDMESYGSWSGNRHLEYQSNGVDDYIRFEFYYDKWIETNFATCSFTDVLAEYDNRTGDVTVDETPEKSGNKDYVLRLAGFDNSWSAETQTGATGPPGPPTSETVSVSGDEGFIIRDVIVGQYIETDGRSIKITFHNISTASLTIDYAGIMEQDDGPNGVDGTLNPVTFGELTSTTIDPGESKESDWIDINNFEKSKNFLLTMHIPFPEGDNIVSGWVGLAPHSYTLSGSAVVAAQTTWPVEHGYATNNSIYTAGSIKVSYFSSGTATSDVYDTGLANPDYIELEWNIAKNNYDDYPSGSGANLVIKVKGGDDENALRSDTDWSGAISINTLSRTNEDATINNIDNMRFVQFRTEFVSSPTSEAIADYTKTCVLENLFIRWKGESSSDASTLVEVSGYFTTRPTYGIFTVEVDGQVLTKGLKSTMEISEDVLETTVTRSLTTEIEPRNTWK